MVGVENFEISTYWLKASYSASELHTQKSHNKKILNKGVGRDTVISTDSNTTMEYQHVYISQASHHTETHGRH